jgi:hypothetical protein
MAALEEQQEIADRLHGWLVLQSKAGHEFGNLLGAMALVLGDMLGNAAANGHAFEAEVLRMVLEQRFATEDQAVADEEDEGFELDEEDEDEGDRIEGEDEGEGGDEGFRV